MSVTIRRTRTLGAVPMTEQAVWGVRSAGKPRAPSQRPVLAALRSRPTPSGSGRGSDPTVTLLSRHHCFQSPTMSFARKKISVVSSRVNWIVVGLVGVCGFVHVRHHSRNLQRK